MAQPVSTFTPTRFPEPIAPRAAEASSASHGEGTADFGAHLDAQKAAPRAPAPEKAPVHHAARHANRDIEDTRREAARDANPVADRIAAKADALAKKYHAPKDKDHAPETADRSDETGIVTCPVDSAAVEEASPVTKTTALESDAGSGKVVCPQVVVTEGADATELGVDTPVDTIEILVSPDLSQLTPPTSPLPAPLADLVADATSVIPTTAIDGTATPLTEALVQQATTNAAAETSTPVLPAGVTSTGETGSSETTATLSIGGVNADAMPKQTASVPLVGARDSIATLNSENAEATGKSQGSDFAAKPTLSTDSGTALSADALAAAMAKVSGKAEGAESRSSVIAAAAPGKDADATPREAAARHSFADWVNEFASAQGAVHRSGDLVGSLDRAIAGQPPAPGGADALRPTPLQVLPIEIGMQAARGATRFQIRLDPAELGRVDVQLDIRDNGEVHANLVVDRVETLAMLKRDAQTLQYAFEQAGLKQAADGITFSLRGEGQNNQNAQRDGGQNRRQGENAEPTSVPNAQIAEFAMRRVMIPNSSVDRVV